MSSPYLVEKKTLIDNLMKIYPYPRKWFESKNTHVLFAMQKKKQTKKN
jgi:hypothetical protein